MVKLRAHGSGRSPAGALAWGASGREFKSSRPDHFFREKRKPLLFPPSFLPFPGFEPCVEKVQHGRTQVALRLADGFIEVKVGKAKTAIFTNYREIVRPADAEKWFAIAPK